MKGQIPVWRPIGLIILATLRNKMFTKTDFLNDTEIKMECRLHIKQITRSYGRVFFFSFFQIAININTTFRINHEGNAFKFICTPPVTNLF